MNFLFVDNFFALMILENLQGKQMYKRSFSFELIVFINAIAPSTAISALGLGLVKPKSIVSNRTQLHYGSGIPALAHVRSSGISVISE